MAPRQYLERREIRLVARERVEHDDLGRDGHPRHGTLEHELGGGRRGRWAASVYEHLSRTSTHARLTAAALIRRERATVPREQREATIRSRAFWAGRAGLRVLALLLRVLTLRVLTLLLRVLTQLLVICATSRIAVMACSSRNFNVTCQARHGHICSRTWAATFAQSLHRVRRPFPAVCAVAGRDRVRPLNPG